MKEKNIPGIYNYCDRWCERCTFTSRCRNYENTSKLTPEQLDINNKAFWENISSNFKNSTALLKKAAEKHGIDLNQPLSKDEEENYEKRESFLRTASKNHVISKLCTNYRKIVMPFTKKGDGMVGKTRELVSHLHMGIKTEEDVVYTVAGIGDCFEIIQWYLFFIDAKFQRALQGKMEGEEWEVEDGYQKDSEGSAKIALIAVEKSIAAWIKMIELMPSSEDTALDALSTLSQIKQKGLEEFPKAMDFKRPGFDD